MIPEDLLYTDQHEWIRVDGRVGTVGVTDYAQNAMGDVTFVELPAVGMELAKGQEACAVESAKAAVSIYAPLGGKVIEVNTELDDDPGLLNSSPYGEGWVYKIELADEADPATLMDAAAYADFVAGEEAH